jgi:hypothetical protein
MKEIRREGRSNERRKEGKTKSHRFRFSVICRREAKALTKVERNSKNRVN